VKSGLRTLGLWLIVSPLFASPALAADAARGKLVAEVRCSQCHHLHAVTRSIGPGLKGIFNRVPSISGVPFARWDAQALDAWLKAPRAIKPNTTMAIPPIAARDRADVIAYFMREESSTRQGNK